MKITGVLACFCAVGVLSGCFLAEDYSANLSKLDGDLTYVCTTGIGAVRNSPDYQNCRLYYDKLLLQYDVNLSAPTEWQVSKFENRTMPLLNRCRRYAYTPVAISTCLQEQEDLMLAEWMRQKFLREEKEVKKELIRERERERERYEHNRRREEENRYRAKDKHEMKRDEKRPQPKQEVKGNKQPKAEPAHQDEKQVPRPKMKKMM